MLDLLILELLINMTLKPLILHFEKLNLFVQAENYLLFWIHLNDWLIFYIHRPSSIIKSRHSLFIVNMTRRDARNHKSFALSPK